MSTIDIGIAAKPEPVRTQPAAIPTARTVTAPAPSVADDGFYVGSVKIEPLTSSPAATPVAKAWSR